jgi:SH3 domain-containing protein
VLAAAAVLAQISIFASAPDTVGECETVVATVTVSAPGRSAPVVLTPSLAPFALASRHGSQQIELDARGDPWVTAQYQYELLTDRAGTFILPSFEARLGRAVARSRPLRVVVRGQPGRGRVAAVVTQARIDTSANVNFRALLTPDTVYVGEQATYEVAVFFDQELRERLRRNPTFFPPELRSMLAYDLALLRGPPPRRKAGNRCYDALVYQRAVFPLAPGSFVVPPAQLLYALPLSSSFFSREESFEARTDSVMLVAIEPPVEGRPSDYAGAVGEVRVDASLDTTAARVGDPLLLTVRVSGVGNVKLFPRPSVRVPWGTAVASDERVKLDSAQQRISGAKEFDWVLTPQVAGELELPPIRYPFFNPATRRYDVSTSGSETLRVSPGALARLDSARAESLSVMALRTRYRGPLTPPLHSRREFWLAMLLAPLPALTFGTAGRRRRRDVLPPSRLLRGLVRLGERADPRAVRRAFVGALAERLAVASTTLAGDGELARALRRTGVSSPVAAEAEILLLELDAAVYSPDVEGPADGAARALRVFRAIDREARSRRTLGVSAALLLLVAFLGAATLSAGPARTAGESFARGVSLYASQRYADAERAFAASAAAEPRAPDAWANLGTAAWVARDTSTAVVGWQRAQRLEPLASDVRTRLDLLPGSGWGEQGYVPPVPTSGVALVAALLWLAACATAAVSMRRGSATTARRALALICAAAALAALAVRLDERIAGRDVAVSRGPAPMRAMPALGAEPAATLTTGELVRIVERRDVWARVAASGDREGWLEADHLVAASRD